MMSLTDLLKLTPKELQPYLARAAAQLNLPIHAFTVF